MGQTTKLKLIALAVILTMAAPAVFADNLLTNGSFQSGSLDGWSTTIYDPNTSSFDTLSTNFISVGNPVGTYTSQDGDNGLAGLGDSYCDPSAYCGTLSQSLKDTQGASYTFSFYVAWDGQGNGTDTLGATYLEANWVNVGTNNVADSQILLNSSNSSFVPMVDGSGGWMQFSFTETGSGNDTITFKERDDPSFIGLDNVCVYAAGSDCSVPQPPSNPFGSAVPEPSSLLLFATGFVGVGQMIRRKFVE